MLLTQIKADQLAARKAREQAKAALLTVLIGDIEVIGKNEGRAIVDADCETVLRKFVKNMNEIMDNTEVNSIAHESARQESMIIKAYLPSQLDAAALEALIDIAISNGATNAGMVMKSLTVTHKGLYDGKQAKAIADTKF